MRPTEKIENLIQNLNDTTRPELDEKILDDSFIELKTNKSSAPISKPNYWRIAMKTKITKSIAAAIIIIAATLSLTLFDKTVSPAWAIEDTIELLKKFNGIHFKGIMLDEDGTEVAFEAWAKANKEQTASDHLRIETENGSIDVTCGNQRYQYDPANVTVEITEGYGPAISPWLGPELFETLKKLVLDWNETYVKDPATGRDRVIVTCSYPSAPNPRSWYFEFDVESKLPITIKQWDNIKREGVPTLNAESLTFSETLPDDLFVFEIPEGVKIVKSPPKYPDYFDDPNVGMSADGLTDQEACLMIVKDYLQALIEGDAQKLAQLRPICSAEHWKFMYEHYEYWPIEVLEIGQPYHEEGCNLGLIVPYTIKYSNGKIGDVKMVVKIRNFEGEKSCVIAGTYGGSKDFNG